MLHQNFDRLIENDGEKFYSDYETDKRLLTPFILIALPGSKKRAVPINVSTLENNLLIDNLIPDFSPPLFGEMIKGEPMYVIFGADGNYTMELPNLIDMEYDVLGIKGYLNFERVKETLPGVHEYFNPQDRKPVSDFDIPF